MAVLSEARFRQRLPLEIKFESFKILTKVEMVCSFNATMSR